MAAIQAHLTPANLLPSVRDEQRERLEKEFQGNRNPSEFEVELLAAEVGLSTYDVKASNHLIFIYFSIIYYRLFFIFCQ